MRDQLVFQVSSLKKGWFSEVWKMQYKIRMYILDNNLALLPFFVNNNQLQVRQY